MVTAARDDSSRAHASASAPAQSIATLRIGVVTTSYPRVAGEAAGNFVAAHVNAMRALGHDVDVIAAGSDVTQRRVDHGVTRIAARRLFYRAGAPDELERSPRAWLDAAVFTARLTRTIVQHARDWDLIVAHWLAPSAISALPTRAPLLAIAHGGDIHTLRRLRLLGPVLYLLRARDARIAFVSDELLEIARAAAPSLSRWLDEAAFVQPMGIDVAHFAALGRAPATPPMILVVGRLVPIKGIDVAIAAFARSRTAARLVIAGDGPERAALETLAASVGAITHRETLLDSRPANTAVTHRETLLEPRAANSAEQPLAARITFRGGVTTAERDQLLRKASVLIVPSRVLANGRTEGMPMIAIEALAAGVPVIASAVGGLKSLDGITRVEPNDPLALAIAIDRALGSPADPNLDGALADLDWPHVAATLLDHATRCRLGATSGAMLGTTKPSLRSRRHEPPPQCVNRFAAWSDLCSTFRV